MKLNNLSAKKICRLISTGMVFSMLVITGIFGGIMQDTRIFIAGGTLTLRAFFWIWLPLYLSKYPAWRRPSSGTPP